MNSKKLFEIVPIALDYGLIHPTGFHNPCLHNSLNNLNYFLWVLQQAGINGLHTSQVQKKTGFDLNTCKIYLRVLVKIGFARRERYAREEAIWYFVKK